MEGALNQESNKVYTGYNSDQSQEYREGFDSIQIERDMLVGVSENWVDKLILKTEGAVEVLPDILVNQFYAKKKSGKIIEAFGLCVPVGKWRLVPLLEKGRVDTDHDPWILKGCSYSKRLGLEIF
jgi:hypothetical protein